MHRFPFLHISENIKYTEFRYSDSDSIMALFKVNDDIHNKEHEFYKFKIDGKPFDPMSTITYWYVINEAKFETLEIMSYVPKVEAIPLTIRYPWDFFGYLAYKGSVGFVLFMSFVFSFITIILYYSMLSYSNFIIYEGSIFMFSVSLVSACWNLLKMKFTTSGWIKINKEHRA